MKNKYHLISIRSSHVQTHTSSTVLVFFIHKKSVIIPEVSTNSELYWITLKNNPVPGARNVRAWDLGDSLISQKTAGYYGV